LKGARAMAGGAIPDEAPMAGHLAQQGRHEGAHLGRGAGAVLLLLVGQLRPWVGRQPSQGARRGTALPGFHAPGPGPRPPPAAGRFADAQGGSALTLGPAWWLERPGLESSGCCPLVG
jgi:hypothetical protein